MFSASKSGQYQGYQISRSVRLRSSASAYFNRTPASAGNRRTWTWSAWVKRGNIGSWGALFASSASLGSGSNFEYLVFTSSNTLQWVTYSTSTQANVITTQVFRDPSAWYHVVVAFDSTQATASNRVQMYINGAQVTAFGTATYPSLNYNSYINLNQIHTIGRDDSGDYFDGYLTEINFIDGQALTPSSFGAYNAYGVWSPMKYNGTYGTNGFYLNFSDNSGATATTIGKDSSGNGNNWTPNNISVTAGATYDSMLDVPTPWADGGNGRGNYAVLNRLNADTSALGTSITNGNLTASGTTYAATVYSASMQVPSTGQWYYETVHSTLSTVAVIGIRSYSTASTDVQYYSNGNKAVGGSTSAYGASWTTGDVIGTAIDRNAGTVTFYKNGVSQGSINIPTPTAVFDVAWNYITFASTTFNANFGQRPFSYTPPSGFLALNTQNLPTPTILKGNQYFDATTYTGTGAARSVTNGGFQPDFIWIKDRSVASAHALANAVTGFNKYLESNTTVAETTDNTSITAVNADGFTLGAGTATYYTNRNGEAFVAWQWKEGATQGFDIVTYTGNSTASRSISHSLGVTPAMIIVKNRSAVQNWAVAHRSLATGNLLTLDTTGATAAGGTRLRLGDSSAFTVGDAADYGITNQTSQNYVAYLFAEVAGFSRFGSYTGNGSADGPFVFCGFRPRWIMFKRTDSAGNSWILLDTARNTYNAVDAFLSADLSNAESTSYPVDFNANGFKLRATTSNLNANGGTYIFAAFAENPTKYALAR